MGDFIKLQPDYIAELGFEGGSGDRPIVVGGHSIFVERMSGTDLVRIEAIGP